MQNHILLLCLYSNTAPMDLRTVFAIASTAGHTLKGSTVSIVDNNYTKNPGVIFGPLSHADFEMAGINIGCIAGDCTKRDIQLKNGEDPKSGPAASSQYEATLKESVAYAEGATQMPVTQVVVIDGTNPTEANAYRHLVGLIATAKAEAEAEAKAAADSKAKK